MGDRWALIAHASGAIDALFSRGMLNTTASVHALAGAVLDALREDRFGQGRLLPVEKLIHGYHAVHDRLVSASYASFCHFPLWNAWLRVWFVVGFLESARSTRAQLRYTETRDPAFLTPEGAPDLLEAVPGFARLLHEGGALCDAVEAGRMAPEEATAALYRMLGACDFIPPELDIANPARRALSPRRMPELLRIVQWCKSSAPKYVKEELFDFKLSTFAREALAWNGLLIDARRRGAWSRTGEPSVA